MNINTSKLVRFSKVITVIGIITIIAVWLLDFLFLPLAILWVGPLFAIASLVSSAWAYFIGVSYEEKKQAKKNFLLILTFYVVFIGVGFAILAILMDSLFF